MVIFQILSQELWKGFALGKIISYVGCIQCLPYNRWGLSCFGPLSFRNARPLIPKLDEQLMFIRPSSKSTHHPKFILFQNSWYTRMLAWFCFLIKLIYAHLSNSKSRTVGKLKCRNLMWSPVNLIMKIWDSAPKGQFCIYTNVNVGEWSKLWVLCPNQTSKVIKAHKQPNILQEVSLILYNP